MNILEQVRTWRAVNPNRKVTINGDRQVIILTLETGGGLAIPFTAKAISDYL